MEFYRRENYLKRTRNFYDDGSIIKVITGIRRCGKSTLLKSIIEEQQEKGIPEKDIISIELDKKEFKKIVTPEQLEEEIDKRITDKDFKYLFIDEIENVKNFEPVINAYREEGNISVFITGSNSYLLSGELITKLTGRYIEFEMMPLNFYEYLLKKEKLKVDRRTLKRYIDILENAKIIYSCNLFDIKSKMVLKGEKKYYLADFSIYYTLNTDNRISYGPMLENIVYNYLKSKNYNLSVGKIGKLECDFIARKDFDKYFYIQVSKTIADEKVEEREYKPFYEIKNMYPKYLFTSDVLLQDRDGVINVNSADFIYNNKEL